MAAQLITYDLVTPGKDYSKLHDAIRGSGTWWHCLESTWIINTGETSSAIRDRLSAYIDQNDKLLVVGLNGNWATLHLDQECTSWLKAQVGL